MNGVKPNHQRIRNKGKSVKRLNNLNSSRGLGSHRLIHKSKGYILPLKGMAFTEYSHSRLLKKDFFCSTGIVPVETIESESPWLLNSAVKFFKHNSTVEKMEVISGIKSQLLGAIV